MVDTAWTFTVLFGTIFLVVVAFAAVWISQHRHS